MFLHMWDVFLCDGFGADSGLDADGEEMGMNCFFYFSADCFTVFEGFFLMEEES
jgi:hypothetical protein